MWIVWEPLLNLFIKLKKKKNLNCELNLICYLYYLCGNAGHIKMKIYIFFFYRAYIL